MDTMTFPRPKTLTPEMALRVARTVAEALRENTDIEGDVETLAKDIAKYGRPHMDGYELAKTLDTRCYWNCDLNIADGLDAFSGEAYREIERAEKEWAERHNITPPLPIGAKVKLRRDETGVITDIYEHGAAKYLIAVDGDVLANSSTKARRIVNFEDVTAT